LNKTKTYNYAPLPTTYHAIIMIQPVTLTHWRAAWRKSGHDFYCYLFAVAVDRTLMVQSVMMQLGVMDTFRSSTNFYNTKGCVNVVVVVVVVVV
jgi:hypothetical protein